MARSVEKVGQQHEWKMSLEWFAQSPRSALLHRNLISESGALRNHVLTHHGRTGG
jgi:hypothetical protein